MLRIRSRKIIQDLLARKTRTFLVSASIFVGVLGVIALFTTRDLITRQLEEDVRQDELSMIDIQVSVSEGVTLDNATYLETLNAQNETGQGLAALEGIEVVEGQAFYTVDWRAADSEDFEDAELRAYSVPLQDVQIEPMRLVDGEWPQVGQGQVAVEQRFADLHGFAVGDEIVFRAIGAGTQTEETFTIVGLVFHPYIYKGLTGEFPGPEEGVYLQYADAQTLLDFAGYSEFVARYETFEVALENYTAFQNVLLDTTPYVPVFPTFEDPADNAQIQNAAIFNDVLTALAFVTMVVSGFLVINVISTIVFEQKKQIGAMKALGASLGDTFYIYAGIALVYGVIGTVLAVIPGIITGYFVTQVLAPSLDILIEGFRWSFRAVLIGVVLGLIVPVMAAAVPVYNGARIRIIDAITDLGIQGDYGTGAISRFIGRLPLPITMRQAISNVYRKRSQLVLTGLTLTMTVATFMATIALSIILNDELGSLFDRLGYEFELTPNELQAPDVIKPLILENEAIESVADGAIFFIQIDGDFENFFTRNNLLQIFASDPGSGVFQYDLVQGTGWEEDPQRPGVIITQSFSTQMDLGVGDDLAFIIGGQRETREIIGVDSNAFDQGYFLWRDLAQLAGSVEGAPRPNEYTVLVRVPGVLLPVPAVGMEEALLTFLLEEPPDPDNPGVVLTTALADLLNMEEGDTLDVTVAGETVPRPISLIVPSEVLSTAAAQMVPQAADIPDQIMLFGFGDLVNLTGVSTEGDPVPNAYYVAIAGDGNPTADEVDDVIDSLNVQLLEAGITARTVNRVEFADALNEIVITNTSIIGVATVLIAAVGAIGLLTTLSITVLERQKEIGVMRSIGADSATIATQFLVEGQIIGFIAWVISIPFSYVLGQWLFGRFQLEYVPYNYPPAALIIGLVGILLVSAISSLGPSLSAARKTVSDILRYQ